MYFHEKANSIKCIMRLCSAICGRARLRQRRRSSSARRQIRWPYLPRSAWPSNLDRFQFNKSSAGQRLHHHSVIFGVWPRPRWEHGDGLGRWNMSVELGRSPGPAYSSAHHRRRPVGGPTQRQWVPQPRGRYGHLSGNPANPRLRPRIYRPPARLQRPPARQSDLPFHRTSAYHSSGAVWNSGYAAWKNWKPAASFTAAHQHRVQPTIWLPANIWMSVISGKFTGWLGWRWCPNI